jgi:hypothetical protein
MRKFIYYLYVTFLEATQFFSWAHIFLIGLSSEWMGVTLKRDGDVL